MYSVKVETNESWFDLQAIIWTLLFLFDIALINQLLPPNKGEQDHGPVSVHGGVRRRRHHAAAAQRALHEERQALFRLRVPRQPPPHPPGALQQPRRRVILGT